MITQRTIRIILSLMIVIFFLLHTVGIFRLPLFGALEAQSYDFRLNTTLPGNVDKRVVIVDLDERSLSDFGQWPWRRYIVADMLDSLFDHYKIRTLGFDIVFAEPDRSSGYETLDDLANGDLKNNAAFREAYEKLRPSLLNDRRFAESLVDRDITLGYYFKPLLRENEAVTVGQLPTPLIEINNSQIDAIPFREPVGFGANLPLLQTNAHHAGYFDNPLVDADGLFRRYPMIQKYKGNLHDSLSLSLLRTIGPEGEFQLGVATDSVDGSQASYIALESIIVGNIRIPVDEQGAVLIPYRGKQGSFPYVSATDVINKRVPPEVLENAIVLVGTTAPGLLDLRSTPVQNVYPGVEVHANIISGALDGTIRHRPAYTLGYEFMIILLVGLVMTFLLVFITPLKITAVTLLMLGGVTGLNFYAWNAWNLVLPLAVTILMIISLFVFHISFGFFVESRGKRQLAKLFGQYIPPELVDEMDKAPEEVSLEGDSREMSVLFSDVRGFTTISEGLDPKELTALMNAFLTPMTGIIHQCRGTIDKYMGDAVMAFWGAPLNDPNHARNALAAAIQMIDKLAELQPEFDKRGWPPINIGVGINTGVMNVGNMGSEFRMAYTVLGDAVNLGSRLEGLTKNYGVQIIVNETTREAVPDFRFRELDRVTVKGKDEPVTIFEPVGPADDIEKNTKSDLRRYHNALQHYRRQEWEAAEQELYFLSQSEDRLIYQIYQERIQHYRANPPGDDWDGVFRHTSK
ncbi:MAG: adenylate/guanylate cyclase domain-containing protein [Pseudomonadota bacterium]